MPKRNRDELQREEEGAEDTIDVMSPFSEVEEGEVVDGSKRIKNSFVEDERALHLLCATGTFEDARDAYDRIIKNQDYLDGYIVVGCDPMEGVIGFLKPLMMAACYKIDLLTHIAQDWIESSENDVDLVHFFLACALHIVRDGNIRKKFVDMLLEKYNVIDVLLLLRLKKYERVAQVIKANCERDPDWWTTLTLGSSGNEQMSYYWAWDAFHDNDDYKDQLFNLLHTSLVTNNLRHVGIHVPPL